MSPKWYQNGAKMEPKRLQKCVFDLLGLQCAKIPPKDLKMNSKGSSWGVYGGLWVPCGSLLAAFGHQIEARGDQRGHKRPPGAALGTPRKPREPLEVIFCEKVTVCDACAQDLGPRMDSESSGRSIFMKKSPFAMPVHRI